MKTVDRPAVINAIAKWRTVISRRTPSISAREQQSFLEGRIAEIEDALARAQIIDPSTVNAGDRVVFGAKVTLFNIESEEEAVYQIVGELEANISDGLISVTSPIARALIGKNVGDVAVVQAPGGAEYEISEVDYA